MFYESLHPFVGFYPTNYFCWLEKSGQIFVDQACSVSGGVYTFSWSASAYTPQANFSPGYYVYICNGNSDCSNSSFTEFLDTNDPNLFNTLPHGVSKVSINGGNFSLQLNTYAPDGSDYNCQLEEIGGPLVNQPCTVSNGVASFTWPFSTYVPSPNFNQPSSAAQGDQGYYVYICNGNSDCSNSSFSEFLDRADPHLFDSLYPPQTATAHGVQSVNFDGTNYSIQGATNIVPDGSAECILEEFGQIFVNQGCTVSGGVFNMSWPASTYTPQANFYQPSSAPQQNQGYYVFVCRNLSGIYTDTPYCFYNTDFIDSADPLLFNPLFPNHSISGVVYNDDNKNGSQDAGETGVSGATVTLNTGQHATTRSDGTYTIPDLPDGTYTETLTVPNGYTATTTNPANVPVSGDTTENFGIYSAPVVNAITAPTSPTQANTSVSTSATFTDGDTTDTHTATWDWGDPINGNPDITSGTVTEPNGSTPGSVTGTHTYTAAGIYTVSLTVTDNDGANSSSTYQYVSVYNPTSQGLFSAGQHYSSPAGTYTANTSLTGTVRFGLSYKYQGTMPIGDRQFTMNFNAANFTFNATSVSSLVVANNRATLTGSGSGIINGSSHSYNFTIIGDNGGGIRIQITDSSNNVIYDTQPGAATTATPTTSVTGNVIAHN
jgi:hypothetical protein